MGKVMNEYIDVRGAWPIYFKGNFYYRLEGCDRSITLAQARKIVWANQVIVL